MYAFQSCSRFAIHPTNHTTNQPTNRSAVLFADAQTLYNRRSAGVMYPGWPYRLMELMPLTLLTLPPVILDVRLLEIPVESMQCNIRDTFRRQHQSASQHIDVNVSRPVTKPTPMPMPIPLQSSMQQAGKQQSKRSVASCPQTKRTKRTHQSQQA